MRNSIFVLISLVGSMSVAEETALQGQWSSECVTYTSEAGSFDYFDTFGADESGYVYGFERWASNDGTCTQAKIYTINLTGDFSIPNDGNVNMTYQHFNFTIHNKGVAKYFSDSKLCGRSDWSVDDERDLFDYDCESAITERRGDVLYSIFEIDVDSLFLGRSSDGASGKTADERHVELEEYSLNRE